MTPIILEWSNAFDIDNNISGYELSYKTTGSWVSLPFISSSLTTGSYSFTPTQQVTHLFRIRVRDSFGEVSSYKFYNYIISAEYQISDDYDSQGTIEESCQVAGSTTYSPIFLSSTPPDIGVTVYIDSGMTSHFIGHDYNWIIKSPSGLEYSCRISGNTSTSGGIIEDFYLCGANTTQASGYNTTTNIWTGRNTAAATCNLQLTGTLYWNSQDFVVGTILYTDAACTIPFIGSQKYFMVEYTNTSGLTLTRVVRIGNLTNSSVIVSIENKSTVCSTVSMAYRTPLGVATLDGTTLCGTPATTKCYIRLGDPSTITTGDVVYNSGSGGAGTTFSGGDGYYNIYLATAAAEYTNPICQVNNNGYIIVQGYCSGNAAGCCFLPGTSITLFDGSSINIEDIIGGESLLTYNTEKLTFEEGLVTNIFTPIHNDIIKLIIGNNTIDCTSTHPFWSVNKNEWVSWNPKQTILNMNINIEQLEIGDILLNEKNEEVILDNIIEMDTEDIVTYDISVEPNHTYYANTILVHNKLDENGIPIIFNELNYNNSLQNP